MNAPRRTLTVRLPRIAREPSIGVWLAVVVVFVAIGFAIGAITGGGSSSPASVSTIAQPQARSLEGAVPDVGSVGSLPSMRHHQSAPVQTESSGGGGERTQPVSTTGGGSTVASTPTVSSPAPRRQSAPKTSPSPEKGHKETGGSGG
jgi:hypothetical protein